MTGLTMKGRVAQEVEVVAKVKRRRFTTAYKRQVLQEADRCQQPGEVGALLRREGLYSSHLTTWRAARARGELAGTGAKRGPKPKREAPEAKRLVQLERENRRLRARAERAEALVEVQKKTLGPAPAGRRAGHRAQLMQTVSELGPRLGVRPTCAALSVAPASYYRWRRPGPPREPRRSARALTVAEQLTVLAVLHSERFVDVAPAEVVATLLDEGRYLCSERTMYRLLAAHQEVRERRNQVRHPSYAAPELLATAPNQLWSWDITKLKGPAKWVYYYLYVILDVFSRYVVGWMVAPQESGTLAERLIAASCARQRIARGQLTLHADRGASMRSKVVALLLADLGVTKTHSRPYTSTDNPYSEALFKTAKYRPEIPERFGCLEHARQVFGPLFTWYNTVHRHSGLAMLTPRDVHDGVAPQRLAERAAVLAAAYAAHPERFPRGVPTPGRLPEAVWINQPAACGCAETIELAGCPRSDDLKRRRESSTLASVGITSREEELVLTTAH